MEDETKKVEKVKGPEVIVVDVGVKLHELGVSAEVIERLKTVQGVEKEADLADLTEADLIEAGMKKIPARNLLKALKPASAASEAAASMVGTVSFDAVLPPVPSDSSWLEALRTGGVLKVDQSTVISAVRATLAHKVGLFSIPEMLVTKMEAFADGIDEQVDPEFFKIRRQLTRRNYAEIFEAIPGLDGSYVTEPRKKQLFQRVDQHLWPAISEFYKQLKSWQEAWMQGANPMVMMSAFFAASGGLGAAMPPGLMQPPDTGVIRDHADAVADASNKVFAGVGVQIAAALGFEANKIKETLTNSRLPAMMGAANRDQMLRQLGVAVSATYPRMEQNLTQFVLGIMQVKDQPAGKDELRYFGALFMLGSQIPWDQLGDGSGRDAKLSGIGKGRNNL
jgi:hypothetical protein